jgi:hypothetical protein
VYLREHPALQSWFPGASLYQRPKEKPIGEYAIRPSFTEDS